MSGIGSVSFSNVQQPYVGKVSQSPPAQGGAYSCAQPQFAGKGKNTSNFCLDGGVFSGPLLGCLGCCAAPFLLLGAAFLFLKRKFASA